MDKKRQIIIKLLLITIFVLVFIGTLVEFDIISFENNNLPETISLNKMEIGIKKSDSYNLTSIIYPLNSFNGKVEWESSDTSIATVSSDGLVSGLKEGTTIITASIPYNKISTSCTIHVIEED